MHRCDDAFPSGVPPTPCSPGSAQWVGPQPAGWPEGRREEHALALQAPGCASHFLPRPLARTEAQWPVQLQRLRWHLCPGQPRAVQLTLALQGRGAASGRLGLWCGSSAVRGRLGPAASRPRPWSWLWRALCLCAAGGTGDADPLAQCWPGSRSRRRELQLLPERRRLAGDVWLGPQGRELGGQPGALAFLKPALLCSPFPQAAVPTGGTSCGQGGVGAQTGRSRERLPAQQDPEQVSSCACPWPSRPCPGAAQVSSCGPRRVPGKR